MLALQLDRQEADRQISMRKALYADYLAAAAKLSHARQAFTGMLFERSLGEIGPMGTAERVLSSADSMLADVGAFRVLHERLALAAPTDVLRAAMTYHLAVLSEAGRLESDSDQERTHLYTALLVAMRADVGVATSREGFAYYQRL
jgi:hypothetical protein